MGKKINWNNELTSPSSSPQIGIVRAPVFTTLMQVASRLLLVWGITFPFPQVASSPAYTSMLLAWSVTEVIRYSYFGAAYAGGGDPPSVLLWLRYNTFFVLYPVGILSEVALIVMSLEPAAAVMEVLQWPLFAILGIYAPCKSAHVLKAGAAEMPARIWCIA